MLMFIGACAGSTGGGIKVARLVILTKSALCDMKRMLHPNAVTTVRFEGRPLAEKNVRGVHMFLAVYLLVFCVSCLLVSLEQVDLVTVFTAVASCINNIGPGLEIVGPMGNFSSFSDCCCLPPLSGGRSCPSGRSVIDSAPPQPKLRRSALWRKEIP